MAQRLRVLLTGAEGQLGRELRRQWESRVELFAFAGRKPSLGGPSLDLTQSEKLATLIRTLRPQVIINAAAYTQVDRAESEVELAFRVNADAPRLMASLAEEIAADFITVSTDYVFSGRGQDAFTEDDACDPQNVYGQSKRAGEIAVLAACERAIVLRTSWVFSEHGQNFIKTMLKLGAQRSQLKVVADQWGAPTSAITLANAISGFLQARLATTQDLGLASIRGIYHCTDQGFINWFGFAEAIFAEARARNFPLRLQELLPCSTEEYPTPARRPLNSRLSQVKLQKTLGFYAPPWQQSMRDVVAILCDAGQLIPALSPSP